MSQIYRGNSTVLYDGIGREASELGGWVPALSDVDRWKEAEDLRFSGLILTDVTVLAHPSTKAGTVISTNQVFARVSIEARLPCTFINVCKVEMRDKDNE